MKTSSVTTRQLASPLSCCKSRPWPGTKCLSGEHWPTEAGLPSMTETRDVPLQPASFSLSVLLAEKCRNTAQECLLRESWGRQAGGYLVTVGCSDLPFFVVSSDRCQAVLISGSLHEGLTHYLTVSSVRKTCGHHSLPLVPAVYRG